MEDFMAPSLSDESQALLDQYVSRAKRGDSGATHALDLAVLDDFILSVFDRGEVDAAQFAVSELVHAADSPIGSETANLIVSRVEWGPELLRKYAERD